MSIDQVWYIITNFPIKGLGWNTASEQVADIDATIAGRQVVTDYWILEKVGETASCRKLEAGG